MKQRVSLLRAAAKPSITGAQLDRGRRACSGEPARRCKCCRMKVSLETQGWVFLCQHPSPPAPRAASLSQPHGLPRHTEPSTRDGHHRLSQTALAPPGITPQTMAGGCQRAQLLHTTHAFSATIITGPEMSLCDIILTPHVDELPYTSTSYLHLSVYGSLSRERPTATRRHSRREAAPPLPHFCEATGISRFTKRLKAELNPWHIF